MSVVDLLVLYLTECSDEPEAQRFREALEQLRLMMDEPGDA